MCFFFNSLDFFRSPFLSLGIVSVNPSLSKSCFVSLAKLTHFVWFIINRVYSAAGNHSISHSTPTNAATINLVCLIVLSNKLKTEFLLLINYFFFFQSGRQTEDFFFVLNKQWVEKKVKLYRDYRTGTVQHVYTVYSVIWQSEFPPPGTLCEARNRYE